MKPIVVVHGGVSAPAEWKDGCVAAAEAGVAALRDGAGALDAAIAATIALEEDGRFNAGRGSVVRIDGETMEMDAGLMTGEGEIGAVASLRGFRNPILAAREVMDTPHVLLAGPGAARFCERRGLEPRTEGPTPECMDRHVKVMARLAARTIRRPEWRDADWERMWNFETPLPEDLRPTDTVGAVVRDGEGRFAVTNSTGGAVPMLLGRVGDSPIPGAGFWAGPHGAVTTTGVGEAIISRLAAKAIYDRLADGETPQAAVDAVVAEFPEYDWFGALAVNATDHAIGRNRHMPEAILFA
ncbi:MAG: isoaspartyl peptidase/L-asparaginase [Planctomycetota bacterium]